MSQTPPPGAHDAAPLTPRPVRESQVESTHILLPGDLNARGFAFGGTVMKWIDMIAAVAAVRHARSPVVTASMDELHFIEPIRTGHLVVLRSAVNYTARTSMEVGVRITAESPYSGEVRHACSAYLTFVCVDESGRPRPVPPVVPETDEERSRHAAAVLRRTRRLQARAEQQAREAARR